MEFIICILCGVLASFLVSFILSVIRKCRGKRSIGKESLKEHFFIGLLQEIFISLFD